MTPDPPSNIIVALDVPRLKDAEPLLDQLSDLVWGFKIGLELFYQEGLAAIGFCSRYGAIMLDLKLHDTPDTITRTVRCLDELQTTYLTVHTHDREAVKAACRAARHTWVLGVTGLTSSLLDWDHIESSWTLELAGVVCPPAAASYLRGLIGTSKTIVCPGIRESYHQTNNHKEPWTAAAAAAAGADLLVIGRPVIQASDPRAALANIIETLPGAEPPGYLYAQYAP